MSNDKLLDALKVSENKNKTRIEKIRERTKKLQHKFSRQELKEIKRISLRDRKQKGFFRIKKD